MSIKSTDLIEPTLPIAKPIGSRQSRGDVIYLAKVQVHYLI